MLDSVFYLSEIHQIITKDEGPQDASDIPKLNWVNLAAISSLLFHAYTINTSKLTNTIRYVVAMWSDTPEVESEHASQFHVFHTYSDDQLRVAST